MCRLTMGESEDLVLVLLQRLGDLLLPTYPKISTGRRPELQWSDLRWASTNWGSDLRDIASVDFEAKREAAY
jgi:hypothetical protein